jgi:hypothetical protein
MQEFGIGDVIAAFVGAIFGATANAWVNNWREQKHQNSELRGLLRLISSEMHYNDAVMQGFEGATEGHEEAILQLRTDTWDQVSERLAQLLSSDEDLDMLVYYYGYIRLLRIDPSQIPDTQMAEIRSEVKSFTVVADGIAAKLGLYTGWFGAIEKRPTDGDA